MDGKETASVEDVMAFCDGSCLDHPNEPHYCLADCKYKEIWAKIRMGS